MEPVLSCCNFKNSLYDTHRDVNNKRYSNCTRQILDALQYQTCSLKTETRLYNELVRIKQLHKEFIIPHLPKLIKELNKRLEK